MKISLYGRQSNSGTYTFLMEHVMGNKPYSTDMKEMNGNAQIIEGVLADEGAIGYVGVGYVVDKATGKALKGLKILEHQQDRQSGPPIRRWTSRPSTPATIRSPGLSGWRPTERPRPSPQPSSNTRSGRKARKSSSGRDFTPSAGSFRNKTRRTSSEVAA